LRTPQGTLTIFAGGEERDFVGLTPLLSELGRPLHFGGVGAGSAAKLVASLALLNTVAAFGESLALAGSLGLEREVGFQVLETTPLKAQVERRRQALELNSFPPRFTLALARKDARLIAEAAHAAGVALRLGQATRSWLVDAELAGRGRDDYSSILAHIMDAAIAEDSSVDRPSSCR
jgi:3-hydroxyisobutyrate dehydrogenase